MIHAGTLYYKVKMLNIIAGNSKIHSCQMTKHLVTVGLKKDFLLAGRDLQKDQALGGEAIRDRLGD